MCVCVCVCVLLRYRVSFYRVLATEKESAEWSAVQLLHQSLVFFFRFLILNHERNETKDERLINGQHKNGLRFNQAVDPTNPVERKSINLQKKNPVNNPVNNNNNNNNRKRNTDQSVVG